MNVTYTNDQAVCLTALKALGMENQVAPMPGSQGCDGITQLSPDCWLIISNEHGQYSMTTLEECTKQEAWDFFDATRNKEGWKTSNHRAVFRDSKSPSVN